MDDQDIDIGGILNLLRRRFGLILVTLAACLGLAGLAILALTPTFTASALVLVDASRSTLLDPETQRTNAATDTARVDSEVEILRSDAVLLDVIAREGLLADPEFGVRLGLREQFMAFLRLGATDLPEGEAALRSVLDRFRDAVSVQRRGATYLISVDVRSQDPQKAAQLANAVAEAYIADQTLAKIEGVLAANEVLRARLDLSRENMVRTEEVFDGFISANIEQFAADPGSPVSRLRDNLQGITGRRDALQSLSQSVGAAVAERDWPALMAQLESDAVAQLEEQRQTLAASLSEVAAESPVAIDLRQQLAAIESQLADRADAELMGLRTQVAELDQQAVGLRQQIRSDVLASELPVEALTRLYQYQQSADLARNQYQSLLAQSADLQVQAELQIADSRIVSPALPPSEASFPNTRLILALSGLAGLGFGVGLAVIYENFLGGFTSESQLHLVTRLPVVGEIPLQKLSFDTEAAADMVITAPLSHYAESVRRARAGLDQHLRRKRFPLQSGAAGNEPEEERGQVIMVSSSVPQEGKTTLALSLARAYAQSGKSTLLIDCDLRRPAIHKNLGIEPELGLFEYLAGRAGADTLASIVLRDQDTGLSVVVGSKRSDIPTDQLITGNAFTRLIAAAVKNFDVVILDTPPVLPVVDGLYLSQYADAVLFVVRWSATAQSEVRAAISRLEQAKTPDAPVVAVLNQQAGGQARYGKSYQGYYEE
ncbi:Wzz/FepE/Etk N-terminal domain-containing protein [Pelagibacterium sp. 26DY04]|uniref:GumC family protein n=1 Tax=Pelagibacterium sp. 26DY04 TaxID=2967130 RepID=UPI002816054F|nr:Wzz/FepE/Etk N-terminal domain-containing protein [Pelagibacterium sp. 26DY04]WMT86757.1 Wzz/FepE/Etk N-terminal domain-containing protein [Pelagibacterium sp. 26DY04]